MSKALRLIIRRDGIDVSDDCELRNGRSNPFGWSQYEIYHNDTRIGWLESGYPSDIVPPYTAEIVEE